MKLNFFFVPSSRNVCSRKAIVKKLCSTLLTSLALTGATLLFNSAGYTPALEALTTLNLEARNDNAVSIPAGLSRRRGAFNKAVDILEDGAGSNPHLADYLVHVKQRVKGVTAEGENSSGIQPLNAAKTVSPAAAKTTLNAAATSTEAVPKGISSLATGVANIAKSVIKAEPQASVDFESDTTSSGDQNEEPRFTVGDMEFDTNPAIEQWMHYYSATPGGRRTMKIGIDRSDSYLEMAREEFRNAGVPEDLVWLAFVESVWNPKAVSPAAAGGIWQFIPATATDYGLTVTSGNDERANPMKQTRAAAVYLHDLYTVFGDWALAMAAYNSGEPRVMGAIVKNGRANFWELYEKQLLPKETRDYVPKILAAIRIAGQAESYGLASQS